jgi:hypothetical protein
LLQISEDRKKRVIDLYFDQHKTYVEIAQIEKISPRDIHAIIKEEESRRQNYKHQQQQGELSSKAYKLFSEGKTPIQVSITLKLGQPEVTKLYKEYLKLDQLDKLYSVYTELGDEGIGDFLKLYKLTEKEGIRREEVVKLLQLADENNPFGLSTLEDRRKWRIDEIHDLDMQIERSKNELNNVNKDIAKARKMLSEYDISCKDKRQKLENISSEILRMITFVNRYKKQNGEYLNQKDS